MLSQFTKELGKPTLGELFDFDKNIYPIGRLDADSEGLLLLTNDKSINNKLLLPSNKHKRTYLVQVEGCFSEEAKHTLETGLAINIGGKIHHTQPTKCVIIANPIVPERNPPIRYRKAIPTSWIRLTLTEGKNRQVRKMTAQSGYPTLRLIRESIESLNINGMQPGDVVELDKAVFYKKLNLSSP